MPYFFKHFKTHYLKTLFFYLTMSSGFLCTITSLHAQTPTTTNQTNNAASNSVPTSNTQTNTATINTKNENKETKLTSNSNTNTSLQHLSSTLASSVLMLLILGSCIWLIKRHKLPGKNSLLKPISVLSVGTREKVMVIELNDTWMVIGVTSNQISLIQNLQKNPDINITKHNENTLTVSSFSEMLKIKIGLMKEKNPVNEHNNEHKL